MILHMLERDLLLVGLQDHRNRSTKSRTVFQIILPLLLMIMADMVMTMVMITE